ncbi:CAAD domain-containing protein [Synechococcus sp. CBW1002]|uniref:CAAD domain-containing protein n=1 Tax=Synechococcus sp. CBW1002 TaxID=1353134 RepID=UPI0018CFB525|nr:CAAD domain-containing protein [Synechococcus sp. CBW1002]QPN59220.1 CAAD domain-containing protein [Synechococcus sp. CBW1002]
MPSPVPVPVPEPVAELQSGSELKAPPLENPVAAIASAPEAAREGDVHVEVMSATAVPVASPAPAPVLEDLPEKPVVQAIHPVIPVAEPAPLAPRPAQPAGAAAETSAAEALRLPLQFLNQVLGKLGASQLKSFEDLLPVARLLLLAVVAGVALKLTGATLQAIDELPLIGGLLELVGLVAVLNFLARNALRQQKRAELLSRIHQIRKDLLG